MKTRIFLTLMLDVEKPSLCDCMDRAKNAVDKVRISVEKEGWRISQIIEDIVGGEK